MSLSALLLQAYPLVAAGQEVKPSSDVKKAETAKGSVQWLTNYEEAVKASKSEKKPIVMLFTGSDWCSWCTKLEEEALSSAEFAKDAGNNFIFLKLDFPLNSSQAPEVKAQNKQLQHKFDVRSFPLVVVYDPTTDKKIGSTGYRAGGGKSYADYLNKLRPVIK